MALPIITTPQQETPQHTTLSSFTLARLGHPVLSASFSETKDGFNEFLLSEIQDADDDGYFETLVLTENKLSGTRAASITVGTTVHTADGTEVGTVAAVVTGPDQTTLTLEEPLTSPSVFGALPGQLCTPFMNNFGNRAHVETRNGRMVSFSLNSEQAAQQQRMQQALGEIHVEAAMVVLAALNLSATQQEVTTAIVTLAQQGVNLESMIASAIERIELERRAGTFTPSTVNLPTR